MQRIFHGTLAPSDFARALLGAFNRGNLRTQQYGTNREIIVQIASKDTSTSGGSTALTIALRSIEDGVLVEMGKNPGLESQPVWDKLLFGPYVTYGICSEDSMT